MQRLWTIFILFIFVSFWLNGEPNDQIEEPFISSLINTESLVSTLIDNSVSAISGEYINTQTDFLIHGPEILDFKRLYSSGKWHFNRPSYLKLRNERTGQFLHPSGAITTHKKGSGKKTKIKFLR